MKLTDFDYSYPEELVAQHPLPIRDASRMMVVDRAKKSMIHSSVSSLCDFLKDDDLVVINNTRVAPARLFGRRGNGEEVEVLAIEKTSCPSSGHERWRCLLRRAKRMRSGEAIFFGMQAKATVKGRDDIYLILEFRSGSFELAARHHGVPPLPPYIKRQGFSAYTEEDRERYQTVYALETGSAAAPTAGLHLSKELMDTMSKRGISVVSVTLHVGIDTFTPIREESIENHKMHGERVEISREAAREIAKAKDAGRRVVAVGTTSVRALESAAAAAGDDATFEDWKDGRIRFGNWTTDLFILPGYTFRVVDAMLTNFHQPRSSLLMLVSAFAGREFILSCYSVAIEERYRLFSFGDCMLIT